ncbi:50S ribosomal protein L1P [mine drainage metagenome]|uniref:50S ribosomal protein L1P n=1 Tax=mine drainage metagenome TaxID=410659 RepID=T1CA99_9ZZZZ
MEEDLKKKIDAYINENKGKRKFVQSVELAVNFRGVDFSKPANRLNLAIALPNGKGKGGSVAVFADSPDIVNKANELGAKVIKSSDLASITADASKQHELLGYELIAQPSLMPQIAKSLGQFLGPRNKMPKPIIGTSLDDIIKNVSKSIYVRSKGKYLPTVHCMVGTEKMSTDQITENIDAVLTTLTKQLGKHTLRSIYMKLTMSTPVKIQ